MKKLLVFACLALVLIPLAHIYWTPLSDRTQQVLNHLMTPLHMARLYTKAPDQALAMPIPGLKAKDIANTWQASRSGNRRHEGQDLFAPHGTAVYSATVGYVVNIGENRLGGNTVSVLGAGGRMYYYAHLDDYAPDITVGDYVTLDTVLGTVGTTGNARGTPPHLHFGVYTATGAINPLPLLRSRS